jgi:CRISPR-associated endonuclease/helicase Cas3
MGALTHREFPAFFRALWGFEPFPWQQDLLERLAIGRDLRRSYEGDAGIWPRVLDLPTGSGKTAALEIAVFHLALEATTKRTRRAPIRIAFVVDRRLIVDDAYERAKQIARALRWSLLDIESARKLEASVPDLADAIRRARAEPVVKDAALQLCDLAGANQPPLVARRLRGGAPREDDWARTPIQPTILCSTVDQVGSRLLFRGYGLSDRMKPIHAGLLGSDCLVLLDEAHLSEPFAQTLRAIERLRVSEKDAAPFGFAVLTATPGQQDDTHGERTLPFALSSIDEAHPILSRRIAAKKPARLVEIPGKSRIEAESERAAAIIAEAKATLDALRSRISNPAIGVVTNRVGRARAVFERLIAELAGQADVTLIIGPARSVDRDDRAAELDLIRTVRPGVFRELNRPLIIVATQTIEAGVDIDLDGLVTEAAALDALRQRFGRLNRGGREIVPEAVLLAHKIDIDAKADDPVYGDRIRSTWEKLQQVAADGMVDFGIDALRKHIPEGEVSKLASPTKDAPVLLPAYADLWSQTSPIPNADPDVSLFLHGVDRSPPAIQVVWRADIHIADLRVANKVHLVELLGLVPPRAAEAIEMPLWAARAWLDETGAHADFSDAIQRAAGDAEEPPSRRYVFRWAGEDSARTGIVYASELKNGDLIVVPAEYGGCDQWGWNPKSNEPVIDVANRALSPYRGRYFAVRVAADLIVQGRRSETWESKAAVEIAEKLSETLGEHEDDRRTDDILASTLDLSILSTELREDLEQLQPEARRGSLEASFVYGRDADERPRGVVFVAPCGVRVTDDHVEVVAVPSTESDDLSAIADRAVLLLDHSKHVRDWADAFSLGAGLPQALREDIALSGYLHDPGKADARWQQYVSGGDPYGPVSEHVLAKSGRRPPPNAWERSGLPPKWRHEALSVRIARLHPDFARAHDPQLVLWLIGTHHGYGRPLFPHADERDRTARSGLLKVYGSDADLPPGSGPQSLAFDFEGEDWAQIFKVLKKRYGTWGLARLEAFVRLADHRASEQGSPVEVTFNKAAE